MAAFLFLPVTAGAKTGANATRRVDFANIASLFAEIEEPATARPNSRLFVRLLAFALIVLLAVGDMVLVARPDAAALSPSVTTPATGAITVL